MMNKLLSGLMATALVGSFAIASVMPADAAPVYVPKSDQVQSDVQNVSHTRRHWRMQRRAEWRMQRRAEWGAQRADRWSRRHAWRDRYYDDNDGYYSVYRPRYYRGDDYYRGDYPRYYRRHRPGVTLEFNLGQ
jgi:hypothetical protein